MKIFITGGSGFIGRHICLRLLEKDHELTLIGRSANPGPDLAGLVKYLQADTSEPGDWQNEVGKNGAVINLAGVSIFGRWTTTRKKLIYDSRVKTTHNLVEAIEPNGVKILINTSAIGYYGYKTDKVFLEDNPAGDDFLAVVCRDWEAAANMALEKSARVAIARFGVILDSSGGALGQMLPFYRLLLGGPLGSGKQWFSWMLLSDLVRAMEFLLENEDCSGPFNFSAPFPVSNRDFSRTLGKVLGRPSLLPTPGLALKLAMGEFGSFLLEGQRAIPEALMKNGFEFEYPRLREALEHTLAY
jgi:uncharacterized protein